MPKGYHHLTCYERCQIYALKQRGDSQTQMAVYLGVSKSTISREIRRNSGQRGYRYKQADAFAKDRRKTASRQPRKMHETLVLEIKEMLNQQWSPEQISGRFNLHKPQYKISHETIYKYIWADKRNGGSLYKNLRHRGKKYNKRSGKNAGRGCIPNRRGIEERPLIVEAKNRVGDWELDTVIGRRGTGVIVSIVDRASKLTKLAKVSTKHADIVAKALVDKLNDVSDAVLTMTADNGKEFACHEQVSTALNSDFFFANPYHSWERGLNEHTNGLIRQYFPKRQSLDNVTQADLNKVEFLLNNRPRKVLKYATPIEVFQQLRVASNNVALRS